MFNYGFNKKSGDWEILTREFKEIKKKLLGSLTNFGQPFIDVINGNYENRGELLLLHRHEGVDLREDYMRDTLMNLASLWSRPVVVQTIKEERPVLVRFDGTDFSETRIEGEA